MTYKLCTFESNTKRFTNLSKKDCKKLKKNIHVQFVNYKIMI